MKYLVLLEGINVAAPDGGTRPVKVDEIIDLPESEGASLAQWGILREATPGDLANAEAAAKVAEEAAAIAAKNREEEAEAELKAAKAAKAAADKAAKAAASTSTDESK